jgi:hypothetical protein
MKGTDLLVLACVSFRKCPFFFPFFVTRMFAPQTPPPRGRGLWGEHTRMLCALKEFIDINNFSSFGTPDGR